MCRLEWGQRGATLAAERGDVLVIIDVLTFSTAAVTAAAHGIRIYPCVNEEAARRCAVLHDAEIAVRRESVPLAGRFSLSPTTFLQADSIHRVALPSPNGAACCRLGASSPAVIVGCLLNAAAAARAADLLAIQHHANVTVLACGERWTEPSDEGELQFALEDYLGAGAVLASLDRPHSPEAAVCRAAFTSVRQDILTLISGCASGIELRDRGWSVDVEHAAQLDICHSVPLLIDDYLVPQPF